MFAADTALHIRSSVSSVFHRGFHQCTDTVAVKYGKPPKTKLKSPDAVEPDVYRFRVAAEGGALLNFGFTFKGGDATFTSLLAPNRPSSASPTASA